MNEKERKGVSQKKEQMKKKGKKLGKCIKTEESQKNEYKRKKVRKNK